MVRRAFGVGAGLLAAFGVAAAGEAELATVTATAERARIGVPAKLEVTFVVPEGSHISPDAPLSLRFKGSAAVRVEHPVLHYKDGTSKQGGGPVFVNRVTPLSAGEHDVEIDASYYVCTAELCNRQAKTLHAKVVAK